MKKILTLFRVANTSLAISKKRPTEWLTNLILFFCISAGISLTIAYISESKIESTNNYIVEINNTKDNLTDWLVWSNLQKFKTLKPEIELAEYKLEVKELTEFALFDTLLEDSYSRLHRTFLGTYNFLKDNYSEVLENSSIDGADYDKYEKLYDEVINADPYDALAFGIFVEENKNDLKQRHRILQSAITKHIGILDEQSYQSKTEIQTMMAFTTKLLITAFVIQILIYILWQYVEFSIFRDDK
ncbi:MAG: hypothetical protein MK212_19850 [Saprospiraceae bacterium]|nr:hypothetical protein [Saprospiraceae bacterium]